MRKRSLEQFLSSVEKETEAMKERQNKNLHKEINKRIRICEKRNNQKIEFNYCNGSWWFTSDTVPEQIKRLNPELTFRDIEEIISDFSLTFHSKRHANGHNFIKETPIYDKVYELYKELIDLEVEMYELDDFGIVY